MPIWADGRSAAAIRGEVAQAARRGRLMSVLLVGDAVCERGDDSAGDRRRLPLVPTFYLPARVTQRWGSDRCIATDHPYADPDGDGVPELAVGRLPASNREMLALMIAKTLNHERSADFGTWRRQIHFVAGTGGFGPVTDKAIELASRGLVATMVPEPYTIALTYGYRQSPSAHEVCPLRDAVVGHLDEGPLLFVYIGHGDRGSLLPGDDGAAGISSCVTSSDIARLGGRGPRTIAALFCCYAGSFDGKDPSLSESLFRHKNGPVAVLAGSRVTMPYGMSVLGTELLRSHFRGTASTLGQALLQAKRAALSDGSDQPDRAALDAVASLLSPNPNELAQERAEHVILFNLLGDPLLKLHRPAEVVLDLSPVARAGDKISIRGRCRIRGRCHIDLVPLRRRSVAVDRTSLRHTASESWPESRLAANWPDGEDKTYDSANDTRVDYGTFPVSDGHFSVVLHAPDGSRGAHQVRAFVEGREGFAIGSALLTIEEAPVLRQAAK
jgi:hypothetical protein